MAFLSRCYPLAFRVIIGSQSALQEVQPAGVEKESRHTVAQSAPDLFGI